MERTVPPAQRIFAALAVAARLEGLLIFAP